MVAHTQACVLEYDLPHKAVAVGVDAAGGHPQGDVAGGDGRAVEELGAFDDSDTEAGQVVVARPVEVGHDGGFAAYQGRVAVDAAGADPPDDRLQQRRVVLGHGDVVEEKERLGPAADGVVHTHGHQVDAHGIVAAGHLGHLQLGPHAVGAGDEHRLLVVAGEEVPGKIEAEKARKPVVPGQYTGGMRPAHQGREPAHRLGIRLEVDPRLFVGQLWHCVLRSCTSEEGDSTAGKSGVSTTGVRRYCARTGPGRVCGAWVARRRGCAARAIWTRKEGVAEGAPGKPS